MGWSSEGGIHVRIIFIALSTPISSNAFLHAEIPSFLQKRNPSRSGKYSMPAFNTISNFSSFSSLSDLMARWIGFIHCESLPSKAAGSQLVKKSNLLWLFGCNALCTKPYSSISAFFSRFKSRSFSRTCARLRSKSSDAGPFSPARLAPESHSIAFIWLRSAGMTESNPPLFSSPPTPRRHPSLAINGTNVTELRPLTVNRALWMGK
mmetsp:Transcript_1866/g.2685  ORF Transcript_1866/g.2685 Transcript_1866/m.2685 type:complete len:207 (-) Transcript_1866:332-952(-)